MRVTSIYWDCWFLKFPWFLFSGFYMQKTRKKFVKCKTLAKISNFINKHTHKNKTPHKPIPVVEGGSAQKKAQEN
jgi:hypothetical protein